MKISLHTLTALLAACLCSSAICGVSLNKPAVVLGNRFVRYEIGSDGRNLHFTDVHTGKDYCDRKSVPFFASVKKDGRVYPASKVASSGNSVRVTFGKSGIRADLRVEITPHYLIWTVVSVSSRNIDELTFLDVGLTLKGELGEPFAACLLVRNLKPDVTELPGPNAHLAARCYPQIGIDGAEVTIVACPQARLQDTMKEVVTSSPDLPKSPLGGPWARDADANRGSYLLDTSGVTEQNVDAWVALARSLGAKQIDFHAGHSLRFGDYSPNPSIYPDGLASVRRVLDKLHSAGLIAGLHTYSFFIAKDSPYVTPVPNPGLAKDATFTLTETIPADAEVIPVAESTGKMSLQTGFFVVNSLTVQVDDELITYEGISKDAPYAFTRCKRGAFGTKPASHSRGTKVHHLKECFGLFAPDGDSRLLSEVAASIAEVYNKCGFDMLYFDAIDGASILNEPRFSWHYGSKFLFDVWNRLNRPTLVEMSDTWHQSWYIRSRVGAWDICSRGAKRFVDMHCAYNKKLDQMLLPTNLGWWAIYPWDAVQPERTFPDDIEYLCGKALACDSSLSFLPRNGLTYDGFSTSYNAQRIAAIIKRYEELRLSNYFPESVKARLRTPNNEFVLEQAPDTSWQFRPVQYTKNKICVADDRNSVWRIHNSFGEQPLRVRIEALMSAEPFESNDNVLLADFVDTQSFGSHRDAAGVTGSLVTASIPSEGGPISGRLCARSSREDPTSTWTVFTKAFSPTVNATNKGIGLWIHGDGLGEVLNIQLANPLYLGTAYSDHYVMIDFTGWKYFELIEPESDNVDRYKWPYLFSDIENAYDYASKASLLYLRTARMHFWTDYCRIESLNLWYTNLPKGRNVECLISPIKAIALKKARLKNPSVTINSKTVTFPVELESGYYVEFTPPSDCKLYDTQGNLVSEVTPQGDTPQLRAGTNRVKLSCATTPEGAGARLRVTISCVGSECLSRTSPGRRPR